MTEFWRGSINLHLKIIKTDYHSGRLLVTITPDDAGLAPNNSQSTYSLRQVIDIRQNTEHVINLPYLRNFNFLRAVS